MEFLSTIEIGWGVFALLAVIATVYFFKGYNGPDQVATDPRTVDALSNHSAQRDALTTALVSCASIVIEHRSHDGTPNVMYLPNTPPCRRMALASFEQGARIVLKGGSDPSIICQVYKGINTYDARQLPEHDPSRIGEQRKHH